MFKFLLIIILLCLPPYGWIALLIWAAIAMGGDKKKEGARSSAPSAPQPPAPTERKPEYEPVHIKVNNGRCDVYSAATGCYRFFVGSDVVQASVGGDFIATVNKSGRVDIYRASTGCYMFMITNDAVSAQIQGDDVAITLRSRRTDIYEVATARYKRML